jgi:hypothetical protein
VIREAAFAEIRSLHFNEELISALRIVDVPACGTEASMISVRDL